MLAVDVVMGKLQHMLKCIYKSDNFRTHELFGTFVQHLVIFDLTLDRL